MPKGVHLNHSRGSSHHRWNKAKIVTPHGYIKVRVGIDHPLGDPNGYAYEHLVVWVSSGRPSPNSNEIIHHSNGDKKDNRLSNLVLMSRSEHNRIHNIGRERDRDGRFVGKSRASRLLDGREWNEFPA